MSERRKIEKETGHRDILYVKGMTAGNKIVENLEEARQLGKKKASESAKKLKLSINV